MSEVMRQPSVQKVVVNIGVGDAGERLEKAQKVLEMVTKHKPKITIAKVTNRDLGVREGMPIGCKVTLRGEEAETFLTQSALATREQRVASYSFDQEGNLSFGIPDYTDFEGMRYDPEIGIFGMDVSVVIQRPGYRITQRRVMKRKLPKEHRMTRQEAVEFMRAEVQRRGGRVKPKKQFGRISGLHPLRSEEGHSEEVRHAPVPPVLPRDRAADRVQEVLVR